LPQLVVGGAGGGIGQQMPLSALSGIANHAPLSTANGWWETQPIQGEGTAQVSYSLLWFDKSERNARPINKSINIWSSRSSAFARGFLARCDPLPISIYQQLFRGNN